MDILGLDIYFKGFKCYLIEVLDLNLRLFFRMGNGFRGY